MSSGEGGVVVPDFALDLVVGMILCVDASVVGMEIAVFLGRWAGGGLVRYLVDGWRGSLVEVRAMSSSDSWAVQHSHHGSPIGSGRLCWRMRCISSRMRCCVSVQ